MKLTTVSRALAKLPAKARDPASVIISDFLVAEMSLACACQLSAVGSFELLNLIWTRSHRDKKISSWTVARLLQTEPGYYLWQFNQALIHAARRGDLLMIQWVLTHFRNCHISQDVMDEAMGCSNTRDSEISQKNRFGNWDLFLYTHQADTRSKESQQRASRYRIRATYLGTSQVATCEWLRSQYFSFSICSEADWRVRIEIVRFVLDGRVGDVENTASSALTQSVELGDLQFIQWLSRHITIKEDTHYAFAFALNAASRAGRLAAVGWLLAFMQKMGIKYDPSEAMFAAAEEGQLEVVQCLYPTFSRDSSIDISAR
ncbi:DNA excision repair protein ERCC-6 [Phytophthora pseudosyringae]|uniref:DNA excision repair protein ERCC-6 n=1 Tax=Phytophthora pseudosyringae TaxID=221518 RepID=A0A8T1W026_9STRA|nr:DNA excision repair protein ERCC-6 [Phytophthora pseudosyringae]